MLPLKSVPFEERDEELLLSVMELPVKLREAILLRFYQDMSVNEMAAALGITPAAVSNRLTRAKSKLRSALERRGYHG